MNDLRNRVRKLEGIAKEKKGGKRLIFWRGPGQSEEDLLRGYSKEDRDRAIIYEWIREGVDCPGPSELPEDFLTKAIKVEEIVTDGQITSPQRPREALGEPKISSEGLDKEIQEAIDDLRRDGLSEKEIKKIIEEEENQNHLVALTGRKPKRFRIDEGE